jgi:hypothetical protein
MFESTARIRTQMKNERVIAIRNFAAHDCDLRFDDLLHVDSHSLGIVVSFTIDDDAMRNSLNVENERLEVTGLER